MTVNDDFEVNVFASEPMIRQPMAFCWDDKGRLWIAENMDMFGSLMEYPRMIDLI